MAVAASIDCYGDLPDPLGWADLTAQPDRVAATIRRRFLRGATPGPVQVFQWPKDRTGWRPMAIMDPFDQVAYRTLIGHHVYPLSTAVDPSVVLSSRLKTRPPGWRIEPHQEPIAERRQRGMELLEPHGVLATLDIEEYYPSVGRSALETLCRFPVPRPSFERLLSWLDALHAGSAVKGLPIGPGGSEILGTALLAPGDDLLRRIGLPFLRYMDDTWVFLRREKQFPPMLEAYQHAVSDGALRFTCHPTKCKALKGEAAKEEISRSLVDYARGSFDDPRSESHEVAMELFANAMEDPDQRRLELRAALGRIQSHKAQEAFDCLVADPSLLALAPSQFRKFVRSLLGNGKVAKRTGARDWVIQQVTRPLLPDTAYQVAVLAQAAAGVLNPSKDEAGPLLEAARAAQESAVPVQLAVGHLWSRAQGYKPNVAVEATQAAPTTASRRGFAVTLGERRGERKMKTWAAAIRNADSDLDATAEWLLAG